MSEQPRSKRVLNVCARCGSKEIAVRHRADVLDFKGLTLEVDGLAETVCLACQLTWETEGQEHDNLSLLRSAYAAKRDEVRTRDGLLTSEQIAHALELLALSRTQAAEVFGGGPNAFGKYISGEVLQSVPMDRLLKLTVGFGLPAVAYLREAKTATLTLYGGYSSPAMSGNTVTVTAPANSGSLAPGVSSNVPTYHVS